MARTKEFDPDTALRSAMELFLRHGYEATSVADLVETLGVSRASLYATFGHKDELYRKALDLYNRSQPIDFAEILSRPGPVLPSVREVVEEFAAQAKLPDGSGACLIVNAAVERMSADDAVARQVESSWDFLETTLFMALCRAKAQGELSPDADPRAQARFVLVMLQGIRVLSGSAVSAERIDDAARQTLAALS
ncbi:TetR/AcrR family transcriptional regulator [Stackebrandtia nassauensis]|uniref:Transcriptional regulator, TetR family n=1 Tax=Stackebrandtia nassauensis (strain DSM 44728 / CIP 108903 / NRRL B-16338 / NBRC 102104 / LLR-40K-21) TaxID=446470 RepID=D3Q1N2_STANL|nr:TetR/AcrR family transcriptional regulator [Stackebrandtia nassauensis]ADD39880.1 transcriptional regulator, TetR family [Stackebrandtia nassauensis DSM 44728]